MHRTIEPNIHYWGTLVVLITTRSPGGHVNIGPMSSCWWLGWTAMLGLDAGSLTTDNLTATGECVLNLPSADLLPQVERLAYSTGKAPMPAHKRALGADFDPQKFETAGFTSEPSVVVAPPRIRECPVQLEAVVQDIRPVGAGDPRLGVPVRAVEVRVVRVHVDERLLMAGSDTRIDPEAWRPLIYSFRTYFGLGSQLGRSRQIVKVTETAFAGGRGGT